MEKPTIFLDAGHGGLDSLNQYTTAPTTGKRFTFSSLLLSPRVSSILNQKEFLEGVKNRTYCNYLYNTLVASGFNVVRVYNHSADTSLQSRVKAANSYHSEVNRGIYLSEHSNAANSLARGFSIFTSRGNTQSDKLASLIYNEWANSFSNLPIRADNSDGDSDYEADFFVLQKTIMPAVLIENLFFDNVEDATILDDTTYLSRYAETIVRAINKFVV